MSIDYAELKKTARGRVLLLLTDLHWHTHVELQRQGGARYGARVLELKRLGYEIEDRHIDDDQRNGKEYRLVSLQPGQPQAKRVKVYLDAADVASILHHQTMPWRARKALEDAYRSFKANEDKL